MRILVLLLITLLCCGACKEQYDHKGKTALVEVDGNFLYKEDLMSVLPVGLSKDDSILFAEHYIRSWAEEILLYEKAANNIPDNVDVDKLVENYRKALIMHTYQQELINQKLTNDISEQEIADYYEKNKELFKLESVIRTKIRQFFSKNKDCVRMRIDLNPGVTYVMPLKNLPQPKKKKIGF